MPLIKGGYFTDSGHWYYADEQGNLLSGEQTINGSTFTFIQTLTAKPEVQLSMATIDDKEIGAPHAVPRNQFIDIDDGLYYFDSARASLQLVSKS